MERSIAGRIDFDGITYSRALQRFVEKRLARWVRESGLDRAGVGLEFAAVFSRQGQGHTVLCQLIIRAGEVSWSGALYASGPHDALKGALERLIAQRGGVAPRVFVFAPCAGKRRWVRISLLSAT